MSKGLRVQQEILAKDQTKVWDNFMRESNAKTALFGLMTDMGDKGNLYIGCVYEELKAQGYTVVSHSCQIVGMDAKGQPNVQYVSLLVSLKDGQLQSPIIIP